MYKVEIPKIIFKIYLIITQFWKISKNRCMRQLRNENEIILMYTNDQIRSTGFGITASVIK